MYERHGGSHTRLYKIWCGMRNRCYLPSQESYPRYGGRGIQVCDEWRESFTAFQRWALENGYRSDKSIDRYPDRDGNYEPKNCRWSSDKAQARNKVESKSFLIVEHDGKRLNLSDWARVTRIGYTTLVKRYNRGLRGTELFAVPKAQQNAIDAAVEETRNGRARLTDAQAQEIRESTLSGAAAAKAFKVSEALVSMIRAGTRR